MAQNVSLSVSSDTPNDMMLAAAFVFLRRLYRAQRSRFSFRLCSKSRSMSRTERQCGHGKGHAPHPRAKSSAKTTSKAKKKSQVLLVNVTESVTPRRNAFRNAQKGNFPFFPQPKSKPVQPVSLFRAVKRYGGRYRTGSHHLGRPPSCFVSTGVSISATRCAFFLVLYRCA